MIGVSAERMPYDAVSPTETPIIETGGRALALLRGLPPLGDLLALHARAGIELRFVPLLRPLIEAVRGSGLGFSVIRARNALPST